MSTTAIKVLIADNDPILSESTKHILEDAGYEVFVSDVGSGKKVVDQIQEFFPDLVITEVSLPEMDGIEMCNEIKNQTQAKEILVVFYTIRNEDYSQIAAFNAGADDYITKPVKGKVLLSRICALLKRYMHTADNEGSDWSKSIKLGNLEIDYEKYVIYKDGQEIILPRKEFELLALLSSSPRKVFSRREISNSIWGYEIFAKNRTIDVHIRKIREKIGNDYIKTIKGIGYSIKA